MKKIFKILLCSVFPVILLTLIITQIPLKKAVKVNFKYVSNHEITSSDTSIICGRCESTGPTWEIIGKNNVLFDNYSEQVILKGHVPDFYLNSDLYAGDIYNVHNKYIFTGKFLSSSNYEGESYKVFKIEKWDITYPVNRDLSDLQMPEYELIPYDFGWLTFIIVTVFVGFFILLSYKKSYLNTKLYLLILGILNWLSLFAIYGLSLCNHSKCAILNMLMLVLIIYVIFVSPIASAIAVFICIKKYNVTAKQFIIFLIALNYIIYLLICFKILRGIWFIV